MHAANYDRLAERYDYESWRNQSRSGPAMFLLNFHLFPEWLSGWTPMRSMAHPAEATRRAATTVWQPGGAAGASLLRVDYCETASRVEAHEVLLQTLANFEGPEVARQPDADWGDVAFGSRGLRALAFARANLVFIISRIGPADTPVDSVARALDQATVARPSTAAPGTRAGRGKAPAMKGADAVLLPTAESDIVAIRMSDPGEGEARMFKLFAPEGELFRTGNEIHLRGLAPDGKKPKIDIFSTEHGQSRASAWSRHRARSLSAERD